MSFPLQALRLDALRKLGFDPFFDDILDDHLNILAIMLPPAFYAAPESKEFVKYLIALIEQKGWRCRTITWLDNETYNTNWCGSRNHTHILGPHVQLEVECDDLLEMPELPTLPPVPQSWIIAQVNYDALKKPNSCIAYYMHAYEATFPADYQNTHDRLVAVAKEYIGINAA